MNRTFVNAVAVGVTLLWGSLNLRAQTGPLELQQDATLYNYQTVNGAPLSPTAGTPAGSDGRGPNPVNNLPTQLPLTPGQFQGVVTYGALVRPQKAADLVSGANLAQNAEVLNLPRNKAAGVVMIRARIGSPFLSRGVSFLFGAIIPVPDTDENGVPLPEGVRKEDYWYPEPHSTNNHGGAGYYWSPNARKVFAIQPGPNFITWKKVQYSSIKPGDYDAKPGSYFKDGNNYFSLYKKQYVISGLAVKQPRKLYWTESTFANVGKLVNVPTARVGAINVVYNNNFPERVAAEYVAPGQSFVVENPAERLGQTRTLWYDQEQGQIHAYNIEGRVFLELLGDKNADGQTRQHLGFEIVDVSRPPNPDSVTIELGEKLTAWQDGRDDSFLFSEHILQPGNTQRFTYTQSLSGTERPILYAIRETHNLNDLQVHWLESGLEGLRWPYRLVRYNLVWPDDVEKYSHYVRPLVTETEAEKTAVRLPTLNAPTIEYQDSLDQIRGKLTDTFAYYSWLTPEYPAHRALIRYSSGEEVAFERVFSWLDESLLDLTPTKLVINRGAVPNVLSEVVDGVGGFNGLNGAHGIVVYDKIAYIASHDEDGVSILDLSDPAGPKVISELKDSIGGFNHLNGAISVYLYVDETANVKTLYVAARLDDAVSIVDVSDPLVPVLKSVLVDEVAGFSKLDEAKSVVVENGVLYIVSGSDDSLTLVDVADPSNPVLLSEIVQAVNGITSLDNPYQVVVEGNRAFVASEGSGLGIFDVSDPRGVTQLARINNAIIGATGIGGSRGLATDGSVVYIAGTAGDAVVIVDVADPANPVLLAELRDGVNGFDLLDGAQGLRLVDGTLYVTANRDNAVSVIDVSNPAEPELIAALKTGDNGVNGLVFSNFLDVVATTAYVTGRTSDSLTILDLSPLLREQLLAGNLADSVASEVTAFLPFRGTFDLPEGLGAPRVVRQAVAVGDRIVAPSDELGGADGASYLAGHIVESKGRSYHAGDYIDPFTAGFEEANRGAIIPVNAIPGANQLEVMWFRQSTVDQSKGFQPVYWPAVVGQYTIEWPVNPREIVLASNDGTGGLQSLEAKGSIYYENVRKKPGFNPNEEHALMLGGQGYALRDDLNVTTDEGYTSEPYVLIDYEEEDARPAMAVFKVLREKPEAGIVFDYEVPAGTILQAPMPLPLLDKPIPDGPTDPLAPSVNREVSASQISAFVPGDSASIYASEFTTVDPIQVKSGHTYVVENSNDLGHWKRVFFVERAADQGTARGVVTDHQITKVSNAAIPVFSDFGVRQPKLAYRYELGRLSVTGNSIPVVLWGRSGDDWSARTAMAAISEGRITIDVPGAVYSLDFGFQNPQNNSFSLNVPSWRSDDFYDQVESIIIPDTAIVEDQLTGWRLSRSPAETSEFLRQVSFQDRKGNHWIYRGPHSPEDTATFDMQYYYKTLPGFFFPNLGGELSAPGIVPYLRAYDGSGIAIGEPDSRAEQALPITYRAVWPKDTPTLFLGESLTTPKRGLPAVRGQSSLEILYQQSTVQKSPVDTTVVLHDPTRERQYDLTEHFNKLPSSVKTESYRGKTYFPNLPPHLSERFFLDPNRGEFGALVFRGEFVDAPLGEDYLFLNRIGLGDLAVMKSLTVDDDENKSNWDNAIDSLQTVLEKFVPDTNVPGQFIVGESGTVNPGELAQIGDDDIAVDSYALTAVGPSTGYVTLLAGNGLAFTEPGDPVSLQVIRVVDDYYPGEVTVVQSSNPLNEKLTMRQIADLAGETTEKFEFQWKIASPVDGLPPGVQSNERTLLVGDGDWHHVRFPTGADTVETLASRSDLIANFATPNALAAVEAFVFTDFGKTDGANTLDFTLTEAQPLSPGSTLRMIDPEGNGLDVEVVSVVETKVVVVPTEASSDSSEPFQPVSLIEGADPAFPHSILVKKFTVPAELDLSAVWLSLDLGLDVAAKIWLNGEEVVVANTGLGDTVPGDPPAGLIALPRAYALLPVQILEGGNSLVVQLFGKVAGSLESFNLRLEAFYRQDLTSVAGSQWLDIDPLKFPDGVQAILGGTADVRSLSDNYVIMRYSPIEQERWTDWTTPQLAEGWIKRVLAGINPFNQRVGDLFNNRVNTETSLLTQAGPRWEGDVALNLDSINDYGLIEIYETVLRRGKMLSIDAGINFGPANDALLLAAGYLNDLYMMLGGEAWADAANPTIGIGTQDKTFGDIATALFAFKGQMPSLLEEELALLRGRDDFLQPGVNVTPVYNRLVWNYTRGIDSGEVIYALNYNIKENNDQGFDGVINADDARKLYPQGHGDAYGHYLTALKGYYALLADPDFDWVPRTEAVLILGKPVQVDYVDERKFAAAGAAVARAGQQIFDLTWRKDYKSGDDQGWEHFEAKRTNTRRSLPTTRYWSMDHWANRTSQGAYLNWVVGNAILPETDPDPSHEGIQKIDRTTVPELKELPATAELVQNSLNNAESGLTPLGLSENSIAFDITPTDVVGNQYRTHFEQVYDRALVALNNALSAFDDAKDVTKMMRSETESLSELQAQVADQELAYEHRLIELYGTPYADDIGPGKTWKQGYTGPDLVHYTYVETPEIQFPGLWNYPGPDSDYTEFKLDVTDLPADWGTNYDYNGFGNLNINQIRVNDSNTEDYAEYDRETDQGDYISFHLGPHGFFGKPSEWSGKRSSPGRLQEAISASIASHYKLRLALWDQLATKASLDRLIGLFRAESATYTDVRDFENELLKELEEFEQSDAAIAVFRETKRIYDQFKNDAAEAAVEAFPASLVAGLASGGDMTSAARAAVKSAKATSNYVGALANWAFVAGSQYRQLKVSSNQRWTLFNKIDSLNRAQELRESLVALGDMWEVLQSKLWTINEALRENESGLENYRTLVAQAERIQDEREVFRQRASALVQGFRTRDAAFRIFRNEKLERYKTLFELAARYAYLAAQAYDYETGLLDTDQGREFISRIVRARALGVTTDGVPQFAGSNTGDPGLSGVLAEMKADWSVLKGRLGFNNPDSYSTTASLRTENFRILPLQDGDERWRDVLENGRRENLLNDSDVRRYCMQIDPGNGLPVPGIVVEFSTTIADGVNLFGRRLAAKDHSFSATSFATKIFAAGVVLEGYQGMDTPGANSSAIGAANGFSPSEPGLAFLDNTALSATPFVYLIPMGADSMRTPSLGDASGIRTWNVNDVTIPLPFNIGGSDYSTQKLWQSGDSLSEPLFGLRKHQAFRPVSNVDIFDREVYGNSGELKSSQFTNRRLIGRSVWNSKWKLIIPGRTLLDDPKDGLDRFIKTVKDIKLHFVTYSYSGN